MYSFFVVFFLFVFELIPRRGEKINMCLLALSQGLYQTAYAKWILWRPASQRTLHSQCPASHTARAQVWQHAHVAIQGRKQVQSCIPAQYKLQDCLLFISADLWDMAPLARGLVVGNHWRHSPRMWEHAQRHTQIPSDIWHYELVCLENSCSQTIVYYRLSCHSFFSTSSIPARCAIVMHRERTAR